SRKSVRLLASFVPEDTPPEIFGKFATRSFEGGVASTAGLLIESAREAGTLDALAQEAAKLASEKVENGEALLTLVRLARAEGETVKVSLNNRREELVKLEANQNDRSPVRWSDALIARACLNDPALRGEIGEPMARSLINRSQRLQNGGFLSHLRRDLAA